MKGSGIYLGGSLEIKKIEEENQRLGLDQMKKDALEKDIRHTMKLTL